VSRRTVVRHSRRRTRTWVDGGGWSDQPNGDFLFKIIPGSVPLMFTEVLEAKESGKMVEHGLQFSGSGRAAIVYYECGSSVPSGSKMIDWGATP
jgi:hypothetical protein